MENAPLNPIAAYAKSKNLTVTEFARLMGISKGSAHDLIRGKRKAGPKTARRMEKLTGQPWHKFCTEAAQ